LSRMLALSRGAVQGSRNAFCKRCYGHARLEADVISKDRFVAMAYLNGTAFGQ